MNGSYIFLVLLCVAAFFVLLLCIGVVSKKEYPLMKWVCILLFTFSMTRYLTLIVYGNHPTMEQLEVLRYFYLATSIGLTIPMASAVWYITPFLREKIAYPFYLLLWTPWIIFYLFVIITQPTQIVMGPSYGYVLELTGKFPIYLSIAQGSFVAIMILLCTIGYFKYKNAYLRNQYSVIIAACILLALDGLSYSLPVLRVFPPFTVTEIFGFLSILYAFSRKPLKTTK